MEKKIYVSPKMVVIQTPELCFTVGNDWSNPNDGELAKHIYDTEVDDSDDDEPSPWDGN